MISVFDKNGFCVPSGTSLDVKPGSIRNKSPLGDCFLVKPVFPHHDFHISKSINEITVGAITETLSMMGGVERGGGIQVGKGDTVSRSFLQ